MIMPMSLSVALALAGATESVGRVPSCARWQYEGIVLGMSLSAAARHVPPTEAPLSSYEDRDGARGVWSYPWSRRGEDSIRLTLDHSRPGHPVVGIQVITRADGGGRLTELLWWWPLPDEQHATEQVQQYVWHDRSCDVLATMAMVVENDQVLISIRYEAPRPQPAKGGARGRS